MQPWEPASAPGKQRVRQQPATPCAATISSSFPKSTLLRAPSTMPWCARAPTTPAAPTGRVQPLQQHLEQVVPSSLGPFGPFGSFGSILHGVTAEQAAKLLPPGGRVVFLPRQLRGAVFVFLSLPVYSLPSGHALMCLCCWMSVGASSCSSLLHGAGLWLHPGPGRIPVPHGHGAARTPPPSAASALQSPGENTSPAQLCQEQT